MSLGKLEKPLQSFWQVQILGWLVYGMFYFFHLFLFRHPELSDVHRIAIILLFGFLITSALRPLYRKIDYHLHSLWLLSLLILFISFVSANVWFWGSRFVSLTTISGISGFSEWVRGAKVPYLVAPLFFDTVLFVSWSALYFSIKIWIEWNKQREKAQNSLLHAEKAKLQMLRYQLNPHFLFNALNSIRALIIEDKSAAKQMITELSEFLRFSLVSKDLPVIPLRQEMAAIRQYLAIEKRRYEDKLAVDLRADRRAADYSVLSFSIHPIVESAVRQGMQGGQVPLTIRVRASVRQNTLEVNVCSTGRWNPEQDDPNPDPGFQNAVENVRRRLQTGCPESKLAVQYFKDKTVCVQLKIHKQVQVNNEKAIQYAHCG